MELQGYGSDYWDTESDYTLMAIGGSLLGYPEDYENIDVNGKIVLVKRGEISFADKTMYAAAAGAAGIIVYNNGGSVFYKNQGNWEIPFMMIQTEEGENIQAFLNQEESLALSLTYGEKGIYLDPVAGKITDFSSYGTTPSMELKPEIAAPGGNIYSTLNDNEYGYMSGTSMAAPHVTGGIALLMERIKKDAVFEDVDMTSREMVQLSKNILMNTAVPVMDRYEFTYSSPRVQGAGSMNLRYAMDTKVVITDAKTGIAKVNLNELNSDVFTFDLMVQNYGDENARYLPEGSAQVFFSWDGFNYLVPIEIGSEASFYVDGQEVTTYLDVPAKSSLMLSVTMDIDDNDFEDNISLNPAGYFIEGYVTLYTDDAILSSELEVANESVRAKEEEISLKEEEIEEEESFLQSLESTQADLEKTLTEEGGLYEQRDELLSVLNEYEEELSAIEEEENKIQLLVSDYDQQAYKFALLIGDRANIELVTNYLKEYTAYLDETIVERDRALDELLDFQEQLEGELSDSQKIKIKRKISELNHEIEFLTIRISEIQETIDGFGLVLDDLELYISVYDKVKGQLDATLASINTEKEILESLKNQISDEQLQAIADLELKELEIEAQENQIILLLQEIDEARILLEQLEQEYLELMAEQTVLEEDYQNSVDTYFDALPLSVPYMGFVGDWSLPNSFDVSVYDDPFFAYDDEKHLSYYGLSYLMNITGVDDEGYYNFSVLGQDEEGYKGEHCAISPNGDGILDYATPRFSLLRNMKDLTFGIEDEKGQSIAVLGMYPELKKNYYDSGYGNVSYVLEDYTWDGTSSLKPIEDGQYYYVIQGKLADGETQKKMSMPIYLDTKAPSISKVNYINGSDTLIVEADDVGVGIARYILVDYSTNEILLESDSPNIDLTSLEDEVFLTYLYVEDYAGNYELDPKVTVINDDAFPEVRLSIEPFSVINSQEFEVSGFVYEIVGAKLMIDGNEIAINDDGSFSFMASYTSDGKKEMQVYASDYAGNEISFSRQFYIDSTAPVIELVNQDAYDSSTDANIIYVDAEVEEYNILANIQDNFPNLLVKLNGDVLYTKVVDYVAYSNLLMSSTYVIDKKLAIEPGYNSFVITARDAANEVSTKTIIVHRAIEGEIDPAYTASKVTINNANGAQLYVGQTLELDIAVLLKNGEEIKNPDNAFIVSDSSAVSVVGRTLYGDTVGSARISVKVDDQEAIYEISVKKKSNPTPVHSTNQSSGGNTSMITSTESTDMTTTISDSDTRIELVDESNPQAGISFIEGPYIQGYSDGTFKPSSLITRAEISALINRVISLEYTDMCSFSDVDKSSWAYESIAAMEKSGLIVGYKGAFNPMEHITNAQLATIMSRMIDLLGIVVLVEEAPYMDIQGHWAKEAIDKIYSYGISLDSDATLFSPDASLTRGEVIQMMNQLMKVDLTTASATPVFSDVSTSHPLFRDIQAAASTN
jgi:hypothetical protein